MRDDFARSSFSVDNHNDDEEDDDFTSSTPLQTRILQIVRSSPNYTIKPAKLSHELGISITDASAELCGLLAAVGEGSSFHFEDVGDDKQSEQPQVTSTKKSVKTMVFQFPKDQGAVCPGAGQRDIEVIAPGFGLKAALATWARGPVRRDPVAELRRATHEAAAGFLGVVPLIDPTAFLKQSHCRAL